MNIKKRLVHLKTRRKVDINDASEREGAFHMDIHNLCEFDIELCRPSLKAEIMEKI